MVSMIDRAGEEQRPIMKMQVLFTATVVPMQKLAAQRKYFQEKNF